MKKLVVNREPFSVYLKLFFYESVNIGVNSVFIVAFISIFIGAVTAVQTTYNLLSPFIPLYVVGTITRDMTILELAPTFTAVVFAGKIGSNIAGELGTMRITEQIDALEVMGINSASYLVLPKILAGFFMYPLLVVLAGFLCLYGGYMAGVIGELFTTEDYIYGLRYEFVDFKVTFALIKAYVYAFLITSISAFQGYYTTGGALEVGHASTSAVTNSCVAILIGDFVLAQLLSVNF
jgi:phospholipid/cholesterol/gamma-HCH transport system permease protein